MNILKIVAILIFVFYLNNCPAQNSLSNNELQFVVSIQLPNVMGRIDHLAFVGKNQTVFVAGNHLIYGNTSFKNENVTGKDTIINFEKGITDKLPNGFTQTATGKLQNLIWKIVDDNGNKVVAQLAKNEGDYYNLLILDKQNYQDFTLTVKLKAIAGEEDQGGGLVWRYIDNNNYYIARFNPLEHNFRLYRVENGNRKQLKSVDSNINARTWLTMTVEMKGNKISCSLNGIKTIEATDDTFKSSGYIGLWTKADAVTYFDDFTIHTF